MDAKQVWQLALERLRQRISPNAFATWLRGTTGLRLDGSVLTVSVPSTFYGEHLRTRYADVVRVAVSEVLGQRAQVEYLIQEQPRETPQRTRRSAPASHRAAPATPPIAAQSGGRPQPPSLWETSTQRTHPRVATAEAPPAAHATTSHSQPRPGESDLNPRYQLSQFVITVNNRLAAAAAAEVARDPGVQYNPLLICGRAGLGKTHLLHAIGHLVRATGRSALYIRAEDFTNEIIEAIRQHTTDRFRRRYRAVDVLLVDDVQFIAGKCATEEEFFHTFNTLHESNRQIVLASNCLPQEMRHLQDRLRSRFEWGLIADIQPPDAGQRLEILRAKAASLRVTVPEDALAALAEPPCDNIGALEGTLTRVLAYARTLGQPVDRRLVTSAVAPLSNPHPQRTASPDEIVSAVLHAYGLTREALCGKSREQQVALARQVAMYLLRELTTESLAQIGQRLGGRDHTTVMHGCARIAALLPQKSRLRTEIGAIRTALGL